MSPCWIILRLSAPSAATSSSSSYSFSCSNYLLLLYVLFLSNHLYSHLSAFSATTTFPLSPFLANTSSPLSSFAATTSSFSTSSFSAITYTLICPLSQQPPPSLCPLS